MGMLYKRGNVYWIKYYRNGVPMRESSGSDKEGVAKSLLRTREGDIERGLPVSPRTQRVTFDELAADVLNDYQANGRRSLRNVKRIFKLHLTPFFEGRRAPSITTTDVRRFIVQRQEAEAANAEINRELSALKRAFNLGVQAGKLMHKPYIPMLKERNVRTGFFEPEQFSMVRGLLPPPLQAVVTFAYITGWRIPSEVLALHWRQVDFAAGTVRLDAGTTKNDEGRVFPFTSDLRILLEAQREHTRAVEREKGIICPWVFHRKGVPIRDFYGAWDAACDNAGTPGRIPHDFRRTAVRNLVRAGIAERVAMTMTGHKTRSVFERYNIVSEGDLADAARKLDEAAKNLSGTIAGTVSQPETSAG